jgi:hypothetical protein
VHELCNLDTMTPTGKRKDFGGARPPDFSSFPAEKAGDMGHLAWLPVVRDIAEPGPNETLGPVQKVIEGAALVERRAAVALSTDDLKARDKDRLVSAVGDLAVLVVRLIEQLLADGTIQAGDFRPGVRQTYLDAKAIVDQRLDPPP